MFGGGEAQAEAESAHFVSPEKPVVTKKKAALVPVKKEPTAVKPLHKVIKKDPLVEYYKKQIKNHRSWFSQLKNYRTAYLQGKADRANTQIMVMDLAISPVTWIYVADSDMNEDSADQLD